jgi:hypothetical protein
MFLTTYRGEGLGAFPVSFFGGGIVTEVLLDDPSAGILSANAGLGSYVLLTDVSDAGAEGSFDLQFPGGAGQELSGAFYAPSCPE